MNIERPTRTQSLLIKSGAITVFDVSVSELKSSRNQFDLPYCVMFSELSCCFSTLDGGQRAIDTTVDIFGDEMY